MRSTCSFFILFDRFLLIYLMCLLKLFSQSSLYLEDVHLGHVLKFCGSWMAPLQHLKVEKELFGTIRQNGTHLLYACKWILTFIKSTMISVKQHSYSISVQANLLTCTIWCVSLHCSYVNIYAGIS